MFDQAPNGYFLNDLIVFNGLVEGGYVSKGFIFEPADLTNAEVSELNSFQDQLSLLFASLTEQQRLQVQYFCDSDYRKELLHYRTQTDKATNDWTKLCRNERFERYWQAMTERRLRRQKLIFYISRKIEGSAKGIRSQTALSEYYAHLLEQLRAEFEHVHEMFTTIFSGQGARVIPMTDADHFRHYKAFLNPTLADRFDYDPIEGFAPELSIQENCWHSEGNGQPDFGFFMDGHYHSLIVFARWPKTTYPGIIHRLTSLRLLDYTITVNVDPLPVRKETTMVWRGSWRDNWVFNHRTDRARILAESDGRNRLLMASFRINAKSFKLRSAVSMAEWVLPKRPKSVQSVQPRKTKPPSLKILFSKT